ncbi:MAG: dihydroxyacetone kinase subunit L [Methylococcales bacterium]|nr:MAG: dihydroxyacetone kinase subunit L [Methylococcales bacterium]
MKFTPVLLPIIIEAIADVIEKNSVEVTDLDQALGDGDHVINLQRGLDALMSERAELAQLDWVDAWHKIGMMLMVSVGGASGSLYGTLFIALSRAGRDKELALQIFADVLTQGVEAVKKRGRSDSGEKTLLDVFIPVVNYLRTASVDSTSLVDVLDNVSKVAIAGMESTRNMLATKGRASFLEERSLGHIDAGAKTAQLMICAIVDVLSSQLTSPT